MLLPFLAGVLVTTPFIFLSKKENSTPNVAYAGPAPYNYNPYMMSQNYYNPYMMQPSYPQMPYVAYASK